MYSQQSGGRKKPLSQAEKSEKLLELFHESDIEKAGSKEKGIVLNTVKEILDMLVSDGLVTMEKIGISNYYWSFPGAAAATKKRTLDDLESEVEQAKKRKVELQAEIEAATNGREESEERTQLLTDYKTAEAHQQGLNAELLQFKDCDPTMIDAKEKAAEIAKAAANRWTDNIFSLQSHCREKFMMPVSDFCRNFQIPEELDSLY
ncbi:UNVERIFIED_CONTAM: Meiotic nuclear division protein 1 [Siphonaria sp. JEL0065]|nr:Meiotic nuclear division protein 1 [Siphonaria sp. JEL0065]